MKRILASIAICPGALLLMAAPAQAESQIMDYGALQEIFGEPVTTSASGTPQRASETPVNMTIITADEIRQSGSRSIPEILARVPGLDILETGVNVYDVGVRGYQQPFQPRLLVLLDGRQVFIDDYSRTLWDNIPVNIDDIRQIEIVKGAASAMFGSNAAGGVINIVTYSPLYDHDNVVTIGGGSQSNYGADGTVSTHGAWGGTKFSAGGLREDEFTSARYYSTTAGYPCCDQVPPEKPMHYYVTNSSIFALADSVKLSTEATGSKSAGNTGDPTDDFVIGGQIAETWSARAGLSWDSPYGLISSDNYFNRSLVSLYEPTDGGQPYQFATDLFVSQLKDQFRIGTGDIFRTELEFRDKTFHFNGAQSFPESPMLTEHNLAAAGTWVKTITPSLTGTLAARIDHMDMAETGQLGIGSYYTKSDYSHDVNAWSGNADLVWAVDPLDSLKGGYGRGIQMPSFMQSQYGQTVVYIGSPSIFPGNPDLKPTIVQDFSLEYSHDFTPIGSTLTLSPYYVLNQDIICPFVEPPVATQVIGTVPYSVITSGNIGNSKGYGGEVELKGSRDKVRWDLSYSYTRVIDGPDLTPITQMSYTHSAPAHHVRLWLGYSPGRWELDGNISYLSGTDMLRSTNGGLSDQYIATGGYVSVGGRIAYAITPTTTAALNGTNIQNRQQVASPYPALQRQLLLTLTQHF